MNNEGNISDKDNKRHIRQIDEYVKRVDRLFNEALISICQVIFNNKELIKDSEFQFKDYPKIRRQVEKISKNLSLSVARVIDTGANKERKAAIQKNEAILKYIAKRLSMSDTEFLQYKIKNLAALEQFQERKIDGMNLSQKVWSYIEDTQSLLEAAIDVGLAEGKSAVSLARDCKKYLKEPNKLFRRVRDKYGNLQLSKNAKAYHPGRGVYRSSSRNAQRLTRSEINIAYRTADYKQYNQWDFILGIEVHRANREDNYPCDMCEQLKGVYPKDFKFVGWHPHCRCYTTTILPTDEEFKDYQKKKFQAEAQGKPFHYKFDREVKSVPKGFKDWVKDNRGKIEEGKKLPYFVEDNKEIVDKILGKSKPPLEIAKERHANRTNKHIDNNNTKNKIKHLSEEVYKRTNYKSGGFIEEPTIGKQSKAERVKNLNLATRLAKENGEQFRLLPIIEGQTNRDALNLKNKRFAEFKITSPQTSNAKSSVQNAIKEASRQSASEVWISFDKDVSISSIYKGLMAAFQQGRATCVKEVIIVFLDREIKSINPDNIRKVIKKNS